MLKLIQLNLPIYFNPINPTVSYLIQIFLRPLNVINQHNQNFAEKSVYIPSII